MVIKSPKCQTDTVQIAQIDSRKLTYKYTNLVKSTKKICAVASNGPLPVDQRNPEIFENSRWV